MGKGRLEAFSDGVLAIILTVMVLGLQSPQGSDWAALHALFPGLLVYLLSFLYIGIYWNNHHHMLQATRRVSGAVLWANLGLLFWLSLLPIATGWMGQHPFAALPAAVYGGVMLMSALAYAVLQRCIIAAEGDASVLRQAVEGHDWKGKLSPVLYLAGMGASFVRPWLAQAIYVGVALVWLVPDRRIERTLGRGSQ